MSQSLRFPETIKPEAELLPRTAIARSFGSAAPSYDQHAALQREVADKLLALLPLTLATESVLELGCGTGYCTRQLQQRRPQHLLALDLALPMLRLPGQSANCSALLCADAQCLPLRANCIDLIVSSLTIQWCSSLPDLFAELQRVLKPGGKAVLSTFGPESLKEVVAAWAQVDSYTHVNTFVAAGQLQQQAEQAGFTCNIRSEIITARHASLYALSRALKALGAHNMNRKQAPGLTSPQKFRRAAGHFADGSSLDGNIAVSWEIYYLVLERKTDETRRA